MLRVLLLCTLFFISTVSNAQKEIAYDTMFVVDSDGDFEIGTHINSTGEYSVGLKIQSLNYGLDSYGKAHWGVRGSSLETGILGVCRTNTPLSTNFQSMKTGVRGIAYSSEGIGVFGENSATNGTSIGVGGFVQSADGVAMQGLNLSFTGHAIAVKGTSHSPSARAVVGESLFTIGTGRGVQGTSSADMGVGVYGEALSATGSNVGVKGVATSETGYGVHAENTTGAGLLAESTDDAGLISVSTNGIGAEIESQNNYGVYAFRFKSNKPRYEAAKDNVEEFIDKLIARISKFDPSISHHTGKSTMFRIYRDVRFSKDKSPYKLHFGAHLTAALKKSEIHSRAGYYVHIGPGETMLAGGAYMPDSRWLKAIRAQIVEDPKGFKKIVNSKAFKDTFGSFEGAQLKTAPKGYPKDHPEIELLRYKSFLATHDCTDKEVLSKDFLGHSAKVFKVLYPFDEWLNRGAGK